MCGFAYISLGHLFVYALATHVYNWELYTKVPEIEAGRSGTIREEVGPCGTENA